LRAAPLRLRSSDGVELHVERWLPETPPRAWLQIVHGMGEHAGRYARLAARACARGWAVAAHDQRGHGLSAREGGLGDLGPDGWRAVVRDVGEVASALEPGAPHVLLGHSMGALVVQAALREASDRLAGCALSGAAVVSPVVARLGSALARLEAGRLGPGARSPLLAWLLFGRAARSVRSSRTAFDWLSRDPREVDAYCSDPHCGFVTSAGSLHAMFSALIALGRPETLAGVPRGLPLRFFSGSADPMGGTQAVERLARGFRRAGFERVSIRIYPGARHETLNETNREEVEKELLDWCSSCLETRGQ
jgi:alpha-beta hydrolase superfamily lysophospholipase